MARRATGEGARAHDAPAPAPLAPPPHAPMPPAAPPVAELAPLASLGWAFLRRGTAPVRRHQVLGERASGTNWLHHLLRMNTSLRPTRDYGWKHGFPRFTNVLDDDLLVVSFRAVEPWLLSLYRKPWHVQAEDRNVSFAGFLRQPWRSVVDMPLQINGVLEPERAGGLPLQPDRHPLDGRVFEDPVELRNWKLRAFLGIARRDCNVAFVRHEAALAAPEAFLDALADAYGCRRRPALRLPEKRLGHMAPVRGALRDAAPAFTEADRAFLRARLDAGTEAQLGYPPV